jgi:hypothetical protein
VSLILATPICICERKEFILWNWEVHKGLEVGIFLAGEGDTLGTGSFDVFDDVFGGLDVAV